MDHQRISPQRRSLMLGAAAAGAASLMHPLSVLAQGAEDIVIGGSIPMTGVFAFAGVGINDGIQDYVKIINDAGGIKGRKVRYVPEDTAYKVDVSVAAFMTMVPELLKLVVDLLPGGVMILTGTDRPSFFAAASLFSIGSRPNSVSE